MKGWRSIYEYDQFFHRLRFRKSFGNPLCGAIHTIALALSGGTDSSCIFSMLQRTCGVTCTWPIMSPLRSIAPV